jgi:hypothetical protein
VIRQFVLAGCSGDERGDDVSGVPVQADAGPVVPHRGARIGVRAGLLHRPRWPSRNSASASRSDLVKTGWKESRIASDMTGPQEA